MIRKISITCLLLICCAVFLFAQESNISQKPDVAKSQQSLSINGQNIDLSTAAGTMLVRDENNIPIANFGFTSYSKMTGKSGAIDKVRPIMFAYNGGPGSSSFWLHMGVLGPKRIVVDDPNFNKAAPYQLVNNEYSVLDMADLVMIDPVGTGLSVPVGESEFKDFWGVDQDIRSISLFITQYLIEHGRMNSPKYLLGESYGTFRNAGVMNRLLNQGIALNGVIMVSAVFDLRTLMFPPDDDMPYIVHLPTYAATAWYHKQVVDRPDQLEAYMDVIRQFTREAYLPALFLGDAITPVAKEAIAKNLADFTSISADYWMKADLRVTASEFFAEFLRENRETVGRLDSRYTGISQDGIAQNGAFDPQSSAISPAYIQRFLDYLYETLGVNKELTYSITAGRRPGFNWDWSHQGNGGWGGSMAAINTGPDMAQALSRDPNLKVLILNGYYDVATVFYGVEHSINHLGLAPEIRDNIIMKYYEAGHMMYTHQPSLVKFKKDVGEFIKNTSN